jgi:membrane carboxypeptidase/penicillin-binding protein
LRQHRPQNFHSHINLPAARARANDVLSNMVDAGYMTEGQVYAARRNPATPLDRRRESTPDWYLDWAHDEIKQLARSGKLGNDRVLTVRTGLDVNLQRKAESAIEDALRKSVEQGVGVIVNAETITRNYKLIADTVTTRTRGVVASYRVLREETGAGLYKVEIEAQRPDFKRQRSPDGSGKRNVLDVPHPAHRRPNGGRRLHALHAPTLLIDASNRR